ncbi:hypothetical protein [Metapseudomonas otitidis]|uniref:hypothetical protein n=1 Tax=Metapseudomonas otitidis TaxID=319939 RepID=UPI0013DE85EF|nr:hypothetical protein [Pseudomonas otitidis]
MSQANSLSRRRNSLTADEFNAVRTLLPNWSEERIEAARLHLVEGMTLQATAEKVGMASRQYVSSTVRIFLNYYDRYRAAVTGSGGADEEKPVPPGWELAVVVAPKELLDQLYVDIAAATKSSQASEPVRKRRTKGGQ